MIPGSAYNRVSQELREKDQEEHSFFYEVVLPETRWWEFLRDEVYPKLPRFLKSKSLDPETAKVVGISLFSRDRCYLIEGPDFIRAFREMEGLYTAVFHFACSNSFRNRISEK